MVEKTCQVLSARRARCFLAPAHRTCAVRERGCPELGLARVAAPMGRSTSARGRDAWPHDAAESDCGRLRRNPVTASTPQSDAGIRRLSRGPLLEVGTPSGRHRDLPGAGPGETEKHNDRTIDANDVFVREPPDTRLEVKCEMVASSSPLGALRSPVSLSVWILRTYKQVSSRYDYECQ